MYATTCRNCDIDDEFQRMKRARAVECHAAIDAGSAVPRSWIAGIASHLSALSNGAVVKPLVVSCALMLFQQLSGINAIVFYTVAIFQDAGASVDRNLATIIVGIVQLVSTLAATAMVIR